MAADTTPYIDRDPGDLITAEDWDTMQVMIKDDIDAKVTAAKEDIKRSGVDRATNADKFAGKTDTEWTGSLDERYAAKLHNHEGQSVYRRYIKRFTSDPGLDQVLLQHDLGRFPLVDVYELLPVTKKKGFETCKLLFYYGHRDAEEFDLLVRVYRDTVPLGLPFEQVLAEVGVAYEDDDTIEDVLNDLWDGLKRDPNDEITHCTTPWVEECCGQRRTVDDLKRANQWPDLYLAVKPVKCALGTPVPASDVPGGQKGCKVEVTHVNYRALLVKTVPSPSPLDLMFLLRI